jgi:hypothetical protein
MGEDNGQHFDKKGRLELSHEAANVEAAGTGHRS